MTLVTKTIKINVEQSDWLRNHHELNFSEWIRKKLNEEIEKEKRGKLGKSIKAIIVAAGHDTRLEPLNKFLPKCMLEIKGKTIIERQIENLHQVGIDDIIIVKGYRKEVINIPNIKYYTNSDYNENGILKSLFFAEEELNENFLFLYSDIIFEKRILERLLKSNADITLVVDINWKDHYNERIEHPSHEAELVEMKENKIVKIGKNIDPKNAYGEFIGIAMFSRYGAEILKSCYKEAVEKFQGKEFHEAISIDKAYFTDMIQELIDNDHEINVIDTFGDWVEIDTFEDYRQAWAGAI